MAQGSDTPFWSIPGGEVTRRLNVRVDRGLGDQEVGKRRAEYGFNELKKEPKKPLWKLVLEQFDDMLVKVGWRGRGVGGAAGGGLRDPFAGRRRACAR